MAELQVEVAVVGAGLAGLATAIRLRQLGHEVLLVDPATGPSVGVRTLTPSLRALLVPLGLEQAFDDAVFPEIDEVEVIWAGAPRHGEGPGGWLASVAEIEQLLGEAVAGLGIRRVRGPLAVQPTEEGWEGHSERGPWCALVLVAACPGILPDQRMRPLGPSTVALCTSLPVAAGQPARVTVHSEADGWSWTARDPAGLVHEVRVRDGEPAGRPVQVDVTPRVSCDPVGTRHVVVGAACLALDPLSSQGAQRTIAGALRAAAVVHTLRAWPEQAAAAFAFYRDALATSIGEHRRNRGQHYARAAAFHRTSFWQRRAVDVALPVSPRVRPVPLDCALRPVPELRVVPTARLEGDRIGWGAAVRHPSLDGPVAFVGGHELAPLAERLAATATLSTLLAGETPARRPVVAALVDWLWRRRLLERAGSPPPVRR